MNHRPLLRRSAGAVLLALLAATAPALAAPSDSVLRGFQSIGDYVFVVAGKEVPAEIYQLDNPPSILVISSTVGSPVLLSPRTRTVETVPLLKVAKQADGTADILADAVLQPAGNFDITPSGDVAFTLAGKSMVMREKPPLVGLQKLATLATYNPEYARLEKAYEPSPSIVDRLRKLPEPVKVTVVFGSWCPHCKQMVPRIMKVAEQLGAQSKVQIEFYGVPRQMSADPKVQEWKIQGVPTGIVSRGGKEIGRIYADGWLVPELTLSNIVNGVAQQGAVDEQPAERQAAAAPADAPPPPSSPAAADDDGAAPHWQTAALVAAVAIAFAALAWVSRRSAAHAR